MFHHSVALLGPGAAYTGTQGNKAEACVGAHVKVTLAH